MYYEDDDDLAACENTGPLDSEAGYVCDHCGEEIVVPVDITQGSEQQYVEDCPVCCNPNVISVEFDAAGQPWVSSHAEQDRY